jgi:MinD-like ATPase involved in chromosome partitioning or flagellar assembly
MTSRSAMQREPAVAVGSSQRPWVAELMSYAQDHAGVRVVGTVLSGREAVEEAYDVLLIDDTTSYLTKRLIDRVQLMRRIVVGVYEGTRGDVGRAKLIELGVDAVIDAESSPKEFLARIRSITDQRLVDRDFAEIVADEATVIEEPDSGFLMGDSSDSSPPLPRRSVTVIAGSGGVTEVAVGLATQLARRGWPAVVADLDTIEPSVAQRLGMELSPNVLTAIESIRFTGEIGAAVLGHESGFGVLAGLPSPREWEACGVDDAADLVTVLAEAHTNVIVRINRHLEDLSPFGVTKGRFGVARRLVADADQLVVVGDPSPTGVTSVLAWIGEARGLSGAPVHVVMNHCGRSLFQQGEITEEIGRTFRSASVTFAPEDHRVHKAAWQGEVAPVGRFTKALDPVIAAIAAKLVAGVPGVAD